MPNWLHLLTNLVYHLGLALWIGGAVALGALVAPGLFRALPRRQAGSIFGPALVRFAKLRAGAIFAAIAAAAVKHLVWEQHVASIWLAMRWAALLFLAASVVYELGVIHPRMEARRVHLVASGETEDAEFSRLHRRSEALMKLSLAAAIVALFLS